MTLISQLVEKLRSSSQINILSSWHRFDDLTGDLSIDDVMGHDFSMGVGVELNKKGHIEWGGGKQVLWLVQKIAVKQDLQGYELDGLRLHLALLWWADAVQVYVNGKLLVEGDLFDCFPRVLLSPGVAVGDEFSLAIRLVSPGHSDGALVKSLLVYESVDDFEPGFVADELAVIEKLLGEQEAERILTQEIFNLEVFNLEVLSQEVFNRERVKKIRDELKRADIKIPLHKISLMGHAHLDMAWLWRVEETWRAAQNTFESVLSLQKDFPELIFSHSTPALYAWVEENRPDLFSQIKEAVGKGQWEVTGGFWVEPDLNLISGESIARQLLYGQRYCLEKFGQISPVVWVPDTFGFCWTLPQFCVLGGIEFFVTQKLRWNDTTKFDCGAFWWRSPDGSQIFSYMSGPVGEAIDPIKMAAYSQEWLQQTGVKDSLWLPGVGDHGGGPTRDMLETAQRWQKSEFFPELEFTNSENYLRNLQFTLQTSSLNNQHQHPNQQDSEKLNSDLIPIWDDELYLEFHRGCYTTNSDQKRWNRYSEKLLYQAELFASIATIKYGVAYPKEKIEGTWKKVLFNQFHDILPGSSITEVYEDALPEWQEVERNGSSILKASLTTIISQTILPPPPHPDAQPIFVFNSLNWQRSQVVSISLVNSNLWQVYDLTGKEVISQVTENFTLLFLADDIPPVGYRVFWLIPSQPRLATTITPKYLILENEFLRVTVNPETGDLSSVFDKFKQREILSGPGNQLQIFEDKGQYWDAWNIDPNYSQYPLPPTQLKSIEWVEYGVVESRIRVIRRLGNSDFYQDYILQTNSPLLKISTTVNWQENHVLLKTAFPLNIEADFATYEIPCGAIRRPTKPQTPAEKAKWEVPAIHWADLTENQSQNQSQDSYGVSLINDSKYGYDVKSNQLRLTLLRSPKWPDAKADSGIHQFTYSLYPHLGSWESANTVKYGYELNIPLQVICDSTNFNTSTSVNGQQANQGVSFLNLSADNLMLMAFKQAEDNDQQWVLRFYECHGQTAEFSLATDFNLDFLESVDLLERSPEGRVSSPEGRVSSPEGRVSSLSTPPLSSNLQKVIIDPWKIINFKYQSKYQS
jgi:alpha-mannosidase